MKYLVLTAVFAGGFLAAHLTGLTAAADPQQPAPPPATNAAREAQLVNTSIDMNGYLKVAAQAEQHRRTRRVTEDEFIKMSGEKGTIVLDARSKQMFNLLHVRGALNLSFPDIDVESLAKTLPDKNARILIYCNNNFTPAPGTGVVFPTPPANTPNQRADVAAAAKLAMRGKGAVSSLNISTYTALYAYGYRNVYELGPLLNPATTKIVLEPTKK